MQGIIVTPSGDVWALDNEKNLIVYLPHGDASKGRILGRTVAAMQARFGCRPHNVHAGIGPSLGPCCAQFVNYRTEIPRPLWRYRGAGDLFDFWALSRDQLTAAGVPRQQVTVSGMCTRCRTDLFFSYRGEKTTGRFAAVIGVGASRG